MRYGAGPCFPGGRALRSSALLFLVLVEAAFLGLLPLIAGVIVDRGVLKHDGSRVVFWVSLLFAALTVAVLAGLVRDRLYSRLRGHALFNIRQTVYERLQQLSLTFHSRTDAPGILDRFSDSLSHIENALSTVVAWGVLPGAEASICWALLCWLDWRVGLLGLLFFPWVLLGRRIVAKRAADVAEECRDEEVRVLGVLEESLTARQIIRAFCLEHLGISLFRKCNEILMRAEIRAGLLAATMERLNGQGLLALQTAVLALSVWLAFDFGLSPGKLIALQLLAFSLGAALTSCAEYLSAHSDATLAWRQIESGLRDPAPVLDKASARTLPPLQNDISIRELKYSYDGHSPALSGVSLRIPRGAYIALVGPSGSGKTTLLRLIMRFQDPSGGVISIDGHDIREVTQSSLRSRIGVVLQENYVFDASLSENIRLGLPDTSDKLLCEAARAAGLQDYAATLPEGLDTPAAANGARLDGEAIQRLAIARALLRNPPILLLDEVASTLDATQENAVNQTIREIAKGRTVISATHRLSSVAAADFIYVLDEGKIVEQGSHFELMAKEGFYARLWRKQAGFHFSSDGRHVDVDSARLREFPILEKLPEDVLAELAPYFATETFPAKRDIVCQNDPGDKFYIIARGKVEVWRTEEKSGRSTCVAVLHDGDFFGEITLITGFPRTATVRTRTLCTCISLERGQFTRLIDRFPELRKELSDIAVQRLRESSKAIAVTV